MLLDVGGYQSKHLTNNFGWTIVDIENGADVQLDIGIEQLPFADNTVDCIYCSHLLEHIWPERINFVLVEFRRVLKPEHWVRIVVPDMSIALKAYFDNDKEFLQRTRVPSIPDCVPDQPLYHLMSWWWSYVIEQDEIRNCAHVTGFDVHGLMWYLRNAGFVNIHRGLFRYGCSGMETRDIESHKDCSLYVDACK